MTLRSVVVKYLSTHMHLLPLRCQPWLSFSLIFLVLGKLRNFSPQYPSFRQCYDVDAGAALMSTCVPFSLQCEAVPKLAFSS